MRLNVVVEGPTKEAFVNQVLRPYLAGKSIWAFARSVTTSRKRGRKYRGGLVTYAHAHRDIITWLKQESQNNVRVTTLFDLYALPTDFPGYGEAQRESDPYQKVGMLEKALGADVDDRRFIPHLQLHEFEALLFCDARQLETQFDVPGSGIQQLVDVADQIANPELINDGPDTAPSKRIISVIPAYRRTKASAGPIVAGRIGLDNLRTRCRHFGEWVNRLEDLT